MRVLALIAILFPVLLNAKDLPLADTIILRQEVYNEKITADLDSLVNSWYVKMALINNPDHFSDDTAGVQYPDSVYIDRLGRINSFIQLKYNNIIRNHIHVYTIRQRDKFSAVLGLKDYYFPMIEDIFDSYGLPTELKYMAVIESALNVNAVSKAGATGMWQFMYSTGRFYKLNINSIVDDRRDPVKATHAAAQYLRDLYNIYEDWILVIAAYNCGPGNVNKAIRRSGNKKDYWDIYYRLPRETRGYIPMFFAAAYAVNYYPEHNIRPLPVNFPVGTDTIMVHEDIHLRQISEVMGIPFGELRALNPQYRTGLIPGKSRPQPLTLPLSHLGDFIDLNDTIRRHKQDVYLNSATRIEDPSRSVYQPAAVAGRTRLTYTVKEGDNLGFISEWYRIGLSDLRYWNNISGNTIRIGQTLMVYVDPSRSEYFSGINSMSFTEKQAMKSKSVPVNTSTAQAVPAAETEGDYIVHTVRYGDTIWDIVRLYGNVTTTEILSLNNIADPGRIMVGQKIKIRKKS